MAASYTITEGPVIFAAMDFTAARLGQASSAPRRRRYFLRTLVEAQRVGGLAAVGALDVNRKDLPCVVTTPT